MCILALARRLSGDAVDTYIYVILVFLERGGQKPRLVKGGGHTHSSALGSVGQGSHTGKLHGTVPQRAWVPCLLILICLVSMI